MVDLRTNPRQQTMKQFKESLVSNKQNLLVCQVVVFVVVFVVAVFFFNFFALS